MAVALLNNPRVKITLAVIGTAMVIYLLTGSWLSNLQTTEKAIQTSWVSLKQIYELRNRLLPQFIQLIQYFAPQAVDLQRELNKVYESTKNERFSDNMLTEKPLMLEVMARQAQVANALGLMEIQVKQYPALAQNRQFLMLNMQLQSMDQQIEYHTALLNQNVMIYNSFLNGFPKNWLNTMFLRAKEKQVLPAATIQRAMMPKTQ